MAIRRDIPPQPNAVHADVTLPVCDVAALLRLQGSLHGMTAAPDDRKRALVAGLCDLVEGDSALCLVTRMDPETGGRKVLSVVHATPGFGVSGSRGQRRRKSARNSASGGSPARANAARPAVAALPGDDLPPGAAGDLSLRRRAGMHRSIDSILPLDGLRVVASLSVGRRRGDGRPFTPRQRAIVHLIHEHVAWIYRHDLALASPRADRLPPRQREVLHRLLAGEGERVIAEGLGISPNTVHHYVKLLFRRFGVSSRRELLSRWLSDGPVGDADAGSDDRPP